MEFNCPKCGNRLLLKARKYFVRRPEKKGNKIVLCPNCGHKVIFNKIFKTIEY